MAKTRSGSLRGALSALALPVGLLSLDDGPETIVDMYASIRQGEQLHYLSPHVPFGTHRLRVRVTGEKRAESSGVAVSIDRAEVYRR